MQVLWRTKYSPLMCHFSSLRMIRCCCCFLVCCSSDSARRLAYNIPINLVQQSEFVVVNFLLLTESTQDTIRNVFVLLSKCVADPSERPTNCIFTDTLRASTHSLYFLLLARGARAPVSAPFFTRPTLTLLDSQLNLWLSYVWWHVHDNMEQ